MKRNTFPIVAASLSCLAVLALVATPTAAYALSATTTNAINITQTNALLRGIIGRDGIFITCYGRFEWGLGSGDTNYTSWVSVGSGSGSVAISNTLNGLSPETLYRYRAIGSNSSGSIAFGAYSNFTTLAVPGPTVATGVATDVGTTTATLNGTVNPKNKSTTAWFEWGTTTNYGNATIPVDAGSGNNSVAVSNVLSSLMSGMTYHFRLVATNKDGAAYGADAAFTTISTNANLVSLVLSAGTLNPSFSNSITSYTSSVPNNVSSVTITPTSEDTNATIQVQVNNGGFSNVISGNASSPLMLNAGTNSIEVKVTAQDNVTTKTDRISLWRAAAPPTVTTLPANNAVFFYANLNGLVNPHGSAFTAWFEWGTTASYGNSTPPLSSVPSDSDVWVTWTTGLPSATTIHFRVIATNSAGTSYGNDMMVTTLTNLPAAVVTGVASDVGRTNATLTGIVTPNSEFAMAWFEWGATTNYGSTTAPEGLYSGNASVALSSVITGLSPLTTYHFRLVATNDLGTTYGADMPFITVSRVVTTLADSGAGSLRQTIADSSSGERIGFAPGLTGEITLTSGDLLITNSLEIIGPGAAILAVSGNDNSRVFCLSNSAAVVSISSLTIRNGRAAAVDDWNGGGIYNRGALTLSGCTLANNFAVQGGGLFTGEHAATIVNCTFDGNRAGYGGGIWTSHSLDISCSTLVGNFATDGAALHGGSAGFPVIMTDCTVAYNHPATNGGSIFVFPVLPYALALTNCSVASNSPGAAIYLYAGARAQLCNTIVAGNGYESAGFDVFGDFLSAGQNLIGTTNGATGFGVPGDLCGSSAAPLDPRLGPLADNGGPTLTFPLLTGSPAINAGDDSVLAFLSTDQRGYPRKSSLHVDIGAFETVLPTGTSAYLTGIARSASGAFQFNFTNTAGALFTVLATTNLVLPSSNWSVLTYPLIEEPPGFYQFSDPSATNYPQRFYRVRSH
jgi:hypothetical protein